MIQASPALFLVAALTIGAAAWGSLTLRDHDRETRLVGNYADALPNDPALRAFAHAVAQPVYDKNCAGCHGASAQGDTKRGVPDLRRGAWLYGFGRVSDIERTILYGIRSGDGRAHNVADMPALGLTHKLSDGEISDVANYVLSLSMPVGDEAAVARGNVIFQGKGECFDCHGADASGNIDWGVPALTGATWLYGGTREAISTSVHDGRHGRCPAWIGVLDAVTIRALAILLHDIANYGARA